MCGRDLSGARRNILAESYDGAAAGSSLDMKSVHEFFGADETKPHARLGDVLAVHDLLQIRNATAAIAKSDDQVRLEAAGVQAKIDRAAAPVLKGIAGNFRDSSGDAGLVLAIEFE